MYPIARCTGVALTALFAVLFLDEGMHTIGVIGIVGVATGVVLIGYSRRSSSGGSSSGGGGAALLTKATGGGGVNSATMTETDGVMPVTVANPDRWTLGGPTGMVLSPSAAVAGATAAATDESSPLVPRAGAAVGQQHRVSRCCSSCRRSDAAVTVCLSLLTGLLIATYSVVDKLAISIASPFEYMSAMKATEVVFLAPAVWVWHRDAPAAAWRDRKRHAFVTGVGSVAAYLIILYAMTLTNVSYVVALREMSVVAGAAIGWCVFKEAVTLQKVAGVAVVSCAVALLAFA